MKSEKLSCPGPAISLTENNGDKIRRHCSGSPGGITRPFRPKSREEYNYKRCTPGAGQDFTEEAVNQTRFEEVGNWPIHVNLNV